jgi:hypothetical protein
MGNVETMFLKPSFNSQIKNRVCFMVYLAAVICDEKIIKKVAFKIKQIISPISLETNP